APASPPPYDLSAAFKALGIDVTAAREGADRVRKRAEAGADATIETSRSATDSLLATLKTKNVALAGDDAALRQAWSASLRDHWWLQVQQNGNWVDEDPTLPNAQPGSHLGAAPA